MYHVFLAVYCSAMVHVFPYHSKVPWYDHVWHLISLLYCNTTTYKRYHGTVEVFWTFTVLACYYWKCKYKNDGTWISVYKAGIVCAQNKQNKGSQVQKKKKKDQKRSSKNPIIYFSYFSFAKVTKVQSVLKTDVSAHAFFSAFFSFRVP